ncbi:hypothetical protein PR048_001686 [Dryococelus australis]|uniref:Uncharacterized protein n=1 Tax=Dryococelus australis TaxID=614101 RepID=A0ABQ9II08_9NEOP|nr:hypothetical protein PR048_001686 [Dryococelus australis]
MFARCPSGQKIISVIVAYGRLWTIAALDPNIELAFLTKELLLKYAHHEDRYMYNRHPAYLQHDEDFCDCLPCNECFEGCTTSLPDTPHSCS